MKRTFKPKAVATQPSLSQRVARMEAYLEQLSRGFDELVARYNDLLARQQALEHQPTMPCACVDVEKAMPS